MPKEFGDGLKAVRICTGATCDKCGVRLKDDGQGQSGDCRTFDGALYVTVSGAGYGEFMDGESDREAVFCQTCARELFRLYPVFPSSNGRSRCSTWTSKEKP